MILQLTRLTVKGDVYINTDNIVEYVQWSFNNSRLETRDGKFIHVEESPEYIKYLVNSMYVRPLSM